MKTARQLFAVLSSVLLSVLLSVIAMSTSSVASSKDSSQQDLCHEAVTSAETSIRETFRLGDIRILIDENEACAQMGAAGVDFKAAALAAMKSFLRDGSHIESPQALALLLTFERQNRPWTEPPPADVLRAARISLHSHVDREPTVLRLLSREEQPEGGERVSENWIFALKIPSLSDHLHWAVVDRSGAKPVYNYGFN
jgi:hypothetical protein